MLTKFDTIPFDKRICVALDCSADQARTLSHELKGRASWLKVGMTLYYQEGPAIVTELKEQGFNIFLDLKMHDIPHQVEGAAASAVKAGADMLTFHACGGADMMKAAHVGAAQAAEELGRDMPALLGITVLTSFSEETLAQVGVSNAVRDQVARLADLALASGLDGVVASPQEAEMLRNQLGADAYIVTPGVRPAGSVVGDQSRIATPKAAFASGSSHLVIGRPITQAENVSDAWDAIVAELEPEA